MDNYFYAQLDENNICVGVSQLSGIVPEYNYRPNIIFEPITGETSEGEPIFVSRMVPIPVFSENYIGLHYIEDGKWEQVIAE